MKRDDLNRFTFGERVVHWVVGVSFVVLLFTGLAFSYPSLFWITSLVGGGASARVIHSWTGLVFTVALVFMFFLWLRDMFISGQDLKWLAAIKHYARHQKDKVPPAGKYNGGQKVAFWAQIALGVVFTISGILLWFPEGLGRGNSNLLTTMRLVHYLAALAGGLILMLHIYLGTILYPGTARGILYGRVSRAWAKLHHPLWHKEKAQL
jgi:formate dehydrogenase subunit gamma